MPVAAAFDVSERTVRRAKRRYAEEGLEEVLGNETLSFIQALLDVVIQVHVGLEGVSGGGDAADDLMGLGELFFFGGGNGPVVGDFLGQLAEAKDGEFLGELALEGVDLVSDLGDGHGFFSFLIYPPRVTPIRPSCVKGVLRRAQDERGLGCEPGLGGHKGRPYGGYAGKGGRMAMRPYQSFLPCEPS